MQILQICAIFTVSVRAVCLSFITWTHAMVAVDIGRIYTVDHGSCEATRIIVEILVVGNLLVFGVLIDLDPSCDNIVNKNLVRIHCRHSDCAQWISWTLTMSSVCQRWILVGGHVPTRCRKLGSALGYCYCVIFVIPRQFLQ